jgi:cell division septation protein DedD
MNAPIRSLGDASRLSKGRHFPRSPVLFASIQLGEQSQGFILNASEGGLCVQTAKEIVADGPLNLRFQSVDPGAWVEAHGRIVWRNETKTVAGIEFIDLTPEIVQQIRKWLFFGQSLQELQGNWSPGQARYQQVTDQPAASPPADAEQDAPSDFHLHLNAALPLSSEPGKVEAPLGPSPPSPSESRPQPGILSSIEALQSRSQTLPIAALAILIAVLSVGILVRWSSDIARYTRGHIGGLIPKYEAPASQFPVAQSEPAKSNPVTSPLRPPPVPPARSSQIHSSPGPLPSSPQIKSAPSPSPEPVAAATSGTVLQAAAMIDEQNANGLAQQLHQKNFPVFVSKRKPDPFYRVLIGPFLTERSLRQAKSALAALDIKTIEKQWIP